MVKVGQAWRCTDCDYSSLKSSNLYRHIESKHVQTQFYTCQICNRSFKGSNSFNVHMYNSHKNIKWIIDIVKLDLNFTLFKLVDETEIQSKMQSLGGGKWQCLDCLYVSQCGNVKKHIESKHVTPQEYSCKYCGKVLWGRHALNNHQNKICSAKFQ